MKAPPELSEYLDPLIEDICQLRARNAFLEEQYEFLLQRFECLHDNQHLSDFSHITKLKISPQLRFIVASLLARYPQHVPALWLYDNLPNHDVPTDAWREDPLNHIRVLVSKIRRYFRENDVPESVVTMDRSYCLSEEAVRFIRG